LWLTFRYYGGLTPALNDGRSVVQAVFRPAVSGGPQGPRYYKQAKIALARAQLAIDALVGLDLHVDELIELALDPGEAGVHLGLEP